LIATIQRHGGEAGVVVRLGRLVHLVAGAQRFWVAARVKSVDAHKLSQLSRWRRAQRGFWPPRRAPRCSLFARIRCSSSPDV
jgi:hypothetical protein